MDKEEATRALAKELVKANGQMFVTDQAYKKILLEKSLSYCPIKQETPFSFYSHIAWTYGGWKIFSMDKYNENIKSYRENFVKSCINVSDANYVFVEHSENLSFSDSYSLLHLTDNLSFFALIDDKEVKNLQRMFYKDVDLNIVRAMEALKIKNFGYYYESYKKDSCFIRNYSPQEGGLDTFLEFVFTIPYEEQKLENNKEILSRLTYHVDHIEILLREYSNGKYFQEYFRCLDSNIKNKVFDNLKSVKERNPIHDSFLWSVGFKELRLDHLEMYKNNTKKFIDYFKNRSNEEKKVIIKDIMSYDSMNDEVINWLNQNYLDLIREVGMNG